TYRANAQSEATIYLTEQAPANGNGNGGNTSGVRPDVGAQPLYGTASLSAGFSPDPHVTSIDAGGSDQNPISGSGCAGYINAERPDLDLNYSAGSYSLFIYAQSQSDTTLLVNLPDGSWVCSDDVAGTNPAVVMDRPLSGNYNVWVGTYSSSGTRPATVFFSERDNVGATSGASASLSGRMPDVSAEPLYETLYLKAGFQPDPRSVSLTAGGRDENPISGTGCASNINAERPDVDLNYTAGRYPLTFYVESGSDTTLLINLPDGSWVCSDDDGPGHDPEIRLTNPMSGNYNVWVGTYGDENGAATLYVTESDR
ncbi:MAG: hypothetical protein R3362_03485, partial [Rhodothermales bacterium]|nr:hypothetical protein [Rhodothermales bacterium]